MLSKSHNFPLQTNAKRGKQWGSESSKHKVFNLNSTWSHCINQRNRARKNKSSYEDDENKKKSSLLNSTLCYHLHRLWLILLHNRGILTCLSCTTTNEWDNVHEPTLKLPRRSFFPSLLLSRRACCLFSLSGRKSVDSIVSSVYWERQMKEISSRDTQNQVFFRVFSAYFRITTKTSLSKTFSATTNSGFLRNFFRLEGNFHSKQVRTRNSRRFSIALG